MSTGTAEPTANGQVNRVIERLASRITETGMPRMRARVLAALLTTPGGALTAIEIGQRLSISSGAVSTTLQSLVGIGLVTREYVPGSRRDIYRVNEDPWPQVFSIRSRWLLRFADAAEQDIDDLGGEATPAGARLAEMREFARFVVPKLEEIVVAWQEHRANRAAG